MIEMARTPTRRRILLTGSIVVAVLGVVGLVWFQPQKLFIDERVNEAAPRVSESMRDSDEMVPDSTNARALTGTFTSLAHPTNGKAVVAQLADGSLGLRLEDFETSNGPDVRVYLSAGPKSAYGKDAVDLGALKGNVGNQNYAISSDVDLDKYDTVVIWCRRFTVAFGAAELS
jgi:hypothetical protein